MQQWPPPAETCHAMHAALPAAEGIVCRHWMHVLARASEDRDIVVADNKPAAKRSFVLKVSCACRCQAGVCDSCQVAICWLSGSCWCCKQSAVCCRIEGCRIEDVSLQLLFLAAGTVARHD